MAIVAIFLAKLLDPIGGLIALVIGAIAASRWLIQIGALVGAVVVEMVLQSTQQIREFSPLSIALGIAALSVWAAVGNLLIRRLFNK